MQGGYRYLPSGRNYYSGNEYKKQYVRLVLVQTGKRGANAQYQIVDAMHMIVMGLIAGATSMMQIVKVWADEVLMKIAGWKEIPVNTTIGRILKRRVRVIFQRDRGFFSGELLDYPESVSAGYLIKASS